jgi:integrase
MIMASINRDPNGRRTIQFVASDGKRRSVRLGKATQRVAEGVKVKVEALVASSITGQSLDNETAEWLAGLDQFMADKLASVGLIAKRQAATLGAFLDAYIAMRADVKPRTKINLEQAKGRMVRFFGADKPLRDVTPGDADRWRLSMLAEGLGENTVRRDCGRAKQFFRAAMRRRLIRENPFIDLKSAVQENKSRFYYISLDEARRVLAECPDEQWRLLFALSRFGGLRCPSEHLALQWGDVDWERNRMTIRSPKTEHIVGKESRVVPLFPELRPYLEAAFDRAEPGTVHVITICRSGEKNFRTRMERIIERAGLTPWPKLFQNLRSTRETELAESFPLHVVTAWIGNSQPVALKHYLQVTDDHFDRAVAGAPSEAVQNPVQQPAEPCRTASYPETQNPSNSEECEGLRHCTSVYIPPRGVEPLLPD